MLDHFSTRMLAILVRIGIVMLLMISAIPIRHAQAQTGVRCFAETELCIRGRIRTFWEHNGGIDVFGLPITPFRSEVIEGHTIWVQWFERNRLELHPENEPPYDVLLGHLGKQRLEHQEHSPQHIEDAEDVTMPSDDTSSCQLFEATGHRVCGEFLDAWQAHGLELDGQPGMSDAEHLALFGLPLTDARPERLADGQVYTVQWFERARFELHPEHEPPYRVQFGLLAQELRGNDMQHPWPRFETSACPFAVPSDLSITCGYLTVPEDRSQADSRAIQLAVAIVSANSATPYSDPVVYLSGGPGSGALVNAVTFARGWSGFLHNRDFVVLDQRGTGFSQPALDCPELVQLADDILGMEITRAEKVHMELDTALRCRDTLVQEGVQVAGYHSAASAADLHDLRVALGYAQWNLFGISYGTRLALTAMRDYPEDIRTAILDSTYPLQVNLFTEMPANMDRSFTRLFENCAHDAGCNNAYPDLEHVFYTLAEELDANPVTVWPTNPHTGQVVKVRVDGAELISLMFRLSYDTGALPSLPQMIYDTHNDKYDLLTSMQQRRLGRSGGRFSHGAYFSVECSEEIAFTTPQEITSTLRAFPNLERFFAGIPENTTEIFGFCDAWGTHAPNPIENEPVYSDIPTLILAGEHDPITPPTWGQLAGETLSTQYYFAFPRTGHAVITRGACPQSIIRAFLDNPMIAPDGSCIR